jgi:hypothetical protein
MSCLFHLLLPVPSEERGLLRSLTCHCIKTLCRGLNCTPAFSLGFWKLWRSDNVWDVRVRSTEENRLGLL